MAAKAAKRRVFGGVNAVEQQRALLARSIRGVIAKRLACRFRFRLDKVMTVAVGDRLLVDGDFETVLAVVTAIHPHNLLDVVIPAGLWDQHAHVIHVRRAPF